MNLYNLFTCAKCDVAATILTVNFLPMPDLTQSPVHFSPDSTRRVNVHYVDKKSRNVTLMTNLFSASEYLNLVLVYDQCGHDTVIFINPALKIIDHEKVILPETCASIKGYLADVPRYKTVEVTGYNEHGNPHYHLYTGWPARIAQHAFHHLDGILFTDIMDPKTLRCVCWKDVNKTKGRMLLPFSPE